MAKATILRAVASVVLLAILTSCVGTSGWIKECDHNLPERGKWENPVYPGAQDVQHEVGQCCGEGTTTFETGDSPDKVLAYYDNVLHEAGWKQYDSPVNAHHDLVFSIANCCYFGTVTVDASRTGQGVTEVKVYSHWSMGCG